MLNRNRTFFFAIFLAIVFSFFRGTFDTQPVTSQQDTKQYRYLELDNQLKVLLVSDKQADHGAASLDVHVGSLQDPAQRPGLAHFLEHMLFLGTKTYPTAGEYQSFINQHGGMHNAFTASEHTNYFFQIDAKQLEGALDRFSRFFYEPLFTEDYVQREKNAVHSEYQSKYKDDFRRVQYVNKALMNPEHPASQFATGSLDTLSDNENSKVRDDLLAFYERYYSANLMTLVIYGPQSLNDLETWAERLFSPIENTDAKVDPYPAQLYLDLPKDVTVQPVKQLLSLGFIFPLNDAVKDYSKKPSEYIGHLLGHEGEGSLLAWLKQQGWAEGLSAGLSNPMANNSTLQVNISLTEKGLQHVDDISAQLFAYIRLVQEQGVQEWVFDEEKQLSRMQFTFAQGQQPASLVQGLSMNMQEYKTKDILQGPYLWDTFDPERIQGLLKQLTPTNVVRMLVAPDVKADQVETYFAAPYSVAPLSTELQESWGTSKLAEGMHLPAANPFVPDDISILDNSKQVLPKRIEQESTVQLWHMQDTSFNGPQSSIFINLRSPLIQQSAHNQVMLDAWVQMLNDHLNSFSYPALLAGQEYSLYGHQRGLGIRLFGYRDKQDVLLNKVVTELKRFKGNEQLWQQAQQELVRAYENALKQKPFERSIAELNTRLIQPSFDESALLNAVKVASLNDLHEFTLQFFDQMEVVMLGHGNISQPQLLTASKSVKQALMQDSHMVSVPRKHVVQLPPRMSKQLINTEHNDSAMTWFIQAKTDALKERATMGLLGQIVRAPYYTYMRTERKFGYVVFATPYPMLDQGGLAFIVQSPTAPSNLLFKESQEFLSNYVQQIRDMSDEDFTAHQQGLITNLLKKPLNLQEKTNRFWSEIDRENDQFNTQETLANYIEQLNQQDVANYLEQHVLAENSKALLLHYDGGL
ncbi:MAG: insulinase family protein [Gammaproteobacteria bacterium]|nr:insulinase family protein [Gammaproteobacteria bacterium]